MKWKIIHLKAQRQASLKLSPKYCHKQVVADADGILALRRCNDGFKETGKGSAIIECKKQQGWVDEAGKGNPAGLECERLRQEPEGMWQSRR